MYHKQFPDYIQQCGLMIDFEHCQAHTLYADRLEDGSLPEVVECDTVATCAVRSVVMRSAPPMLVLCRKIILFTGTIWKGTSDAPCRLPDCHPGQSGSSSSDGSQCEKANYFFKLLYVAQPANFL